MWERQDDLGEAAADFLPYLFTSSFLINYHTLSASPTNRAATTGVPTYIWMGAVAPIIHACVHIQNLYKILGYTFKTHMKTLDPLQNSYK